MIFISCAFQPFALLAIVISFKSRLAEEALIEFGVGDSTLSWHSLM
jgi:hypothetical protein